MRNSVKNRLNAPSCCAGQFIYSHISDLSKVDWCHIDLAGPSFPADRATGHGVALLAELAAIAVERGYARVDWQVLDWNTPSIDFYEAIGSQINREWIPCRLTGDALAAMAMRAAG